MSTSGVVTYTNSQHDIIVAALQAIQVLGAGETAVADDYILARDTLNRMIDNWDGIGFKLWKRKTGVLFLQKEQRQYQIYSGGDHATETFVSTTLSAAAIAAQTNLEVTSSSGFSAGQYIGVQMDNSYMHWDTIDTIPDSTHITLTTGLTYAAASGLYVFAYTTKINNPLNIYSANRVTIGSTVLDTPLIALEYQNYFNLPNKYEEGNVNSYNYDKQLNYAVISVWQVPIDVTFYCRFTYSARTEDFVSNPNTPDFPREWVEAIVLNLAVRLAKVFGRNTGDLYADLKADAQAALIQMQAFDIDLGYVQFQPDYEGRR